MTETPYRLGDPELEPTQRTPRRTPQAAGRWVVAIAVAVVLVFTVVAIVNQNRAHRGVGSESATMAKPVPGAVTKASVSCPLVRDEATGLSYRCIDNYLRGDYPDAALGLTTTLDYAVEPNWEIVQGSGLVPTAARPTLDQVQAEVRARTSHAITSAYGAHPIFRTLSDGVRMFDAVQGFEQVTELHIDADYRKQNHIKADLERLWVLGLPTQAGVAIFMLTIPDNRKDLWPKADAVVATVHVL